jgi:Terpene cyclase DEP1
VSNPVFRALVALIGLMFVGAFCLIVVPAFIETPDVITAFVAGFVNPFASGYSLDTIFCWLLLVVWVIYEAKEKQVRFGWFAIIIGVMPGVAAGLALYLLLRLRRPNV